MHTKTLYLLAFICAGALFFAAMSLNVPVSPREQYQCQQEARTYGDGQPVDCPASETVWQKTLRDPVAYYTGWLTLFTLALTAVGIAQGISNEQQISLTRAAYVAANRPRVKIRYVRMENPEDGKPMVIYYEIVNYGDTVAHIVSNEITVKMIDAPQHGQKIAHKYKFDIANRIANGESIIARTETPIIPDPGWRFPISNYKKDRVIVIGTITYKDDNGTVRRTGFYRISTSDINRFRPPDFDSYILEEHEYQD